MALIPVLLAALAVPAPAEEGGKRAAMGAILESIRILLPLAVRAGAMESPENRDRVRVALAEISDQAAMLAGHAGVDSDEEEFLASALERYASWTLSAYRRGEGDRAAGMVLEMTDLCIACHTRLPSRDSGLARDLVDDTTLVHLPPRERAALETATRQFEAALASHEAVLGAQMIDPARLRADVTRYLSVSVRVKEDYARPLPVLHALSQRDDLPAPERVQAAAWEKSLRSFGQGPRPRSLLDAERLVASAETAAASDSPDGLVEYVAASGVLLRLLASGGAGPEEDARIYYLLGLAEHRLAEAPWIPRAELHLEQAILAAPGSPTARDAYALLSDRILATYEGEPSAMPAEVAKHLDRLRRIAESG